MTKIKAFILAFLVAISTMSLASSVLADETEECRRYFDNFIGPTITARDADMPPSLMLEQFRMIGFPEAYAIAIVQVVYFTHADDDFVTIQASFLNYCLGSDA